MSAHAPSDAASSARRRAAVAVLTVWDAGTDTAESAPSVKAVSTAEMTTAAASTPAAAAMSARSVAATDGVPTPASSSAAGRPGTSTVAVATCAMKTVEGVVGEGDGSAVPTAPTSPPAAAAGKAAASPHSGCAASQSADFSMMRPTDSNQRHPPREAAAPTRAR